MYTLNETGPDFDSIREEIEGVVAELLPHLKIKTAGRKFPGEYPFYVGDADKDSIFILREGNLRFERNNRLLCFFEEGDFVAPDRVCCGYDCKLYSDFAVVVDEYDRNEIITSVTSNSNLAGLWTRFLSLQINMYGSLLGGAIREEPNISPYVCNFSEGEMIIEKGSIGDKVYTMLTGCAEVCVDGVRVGEIYADEVFGVIGALTGTPRTASVIARTDCTILALPREHFQQLLETRFATVMSMIESMARAVVSLNSKVVKLSNGVYS
ncbi:MAG: cyclic nucleotide-binding domain-containing protein [Bdellovibrionales bacterium]|nr:cyclic nucleotide-binding domain-containing protein [Bdellovibrionales bacterium]